MKEIINKMGGWFSVCTQNVLNYIALLSLYCFSNWVFCCSLINYWPHLKFVSEILISLRVEVFKISVQDVLSCTHRKPMECVDDWLSQCIVRSPAFLGYIFQKCASSLFTYLCVGRKHFIVIPPVFYDHLLMKLKVAFQSMFCNSWKNDKTPGFWQ